MNSHKTVISVLIIDLIFTFSVSVIKVPSVTKNKRLLKLTIGLEICKGQALMKIGHKILMANPIGMFVEKISGFSKITIFDKECTL